MSAPPRGLAGGETVVTPRGVGIAAGGGALLVVGIGFASAPLVLIGATALGAAVIGAAWIAAQVWVTRSRVTSLTREVRPPTLTAGGSGEVVVRVATRGTVSRRLALREQAAAELTGGGSTRAAITRGPGAVELRYGLTPVKRGRWTLGPALARAADPFGMGWTDRVVGEPHQVAVWPAVVDLAASAGELMGAADRAHAGARTPAADDASLRDYREGDDLRRVHWASSARRGTLLVRSEEQQGRTAATLLLGLPTAPSGLEWAITAAASIALSVIEAGHPVRLIAGDTDTVAQETHGRAAESSRARLLDATVDLAAPDSTAESDRLLMSGAARLDPARTDVAIAITEPLGQSALRALAPLGDSGRAWALVRSSMAARARGERTTDALRATGWRVVHSLEPEPVEQAWARLLAEDPA